MHIKNFIALLVSLILTFNLNAQISPPSIQWQRCYGGTGHDRAYSIVRTYDGCYIVAARSSSNDGNVLGNHGSDDDWIFKIDTSGNLLWQKCYGSSLGDYAASIQQTIDRGYIINGYCSYNDSDVIGNHGSNDYWIVKIDSSANLQWQKCLGGSGADVGTSINQTIDGGYITAGSSWSNDSDVTGHHGSNNYSDYWVVKIDSIGNIQWQKSLGGTQTDRASSIQQTTDRGYIIVGYTCSNDGDVTGHHGSTVYSDLWVVKLDSVGNIQWQKSLGGSYNDGANSIQQTFDGGYIAAGYSQSNDGDVSGHHGSSSSCDFWVVKLDTVGNLQWQKSLGGSYDDQAYSIQQTNDLGYIVCGNSYSNDGDVTGHHGTNQFYDSWVVKLDSVGNLQWQKSLGGTDWDQAQSIQETSDGGYIVAGFTFSIDGDVSGIHGNEDCWVVKLNPISLMIKEPINNSNISIFPNPSKSSFTVNFPPNAKYIEISTSLGQVLEKRNVFHQTVLSFELKDNGIYFVQIVTDKEIITKKVVISNE